MYIPSQGLYQVFIFIYVVGIHIEILCITIFFTFFPFLNSVPEVHCAEVVSHFLAILST
jgi:hypothetical protein